MPDAVMSAVVDKSSAAAKRYLDGYHVAEFIVMLGTIVKVLGVGAGAVIAVPGLLSALDNINAPSRYGGGPGFGLMLGTGAGLAAVFAGALVAGVGFVFGVLVSAAGQMLRANLDCAVHTSPFLSDAERATAMRLK